MRLFLEGLALLVIAALLCWIAWLMLSPVPMPSWGTGVLGDSTFMGDTCRYGPAVVVDSVPR